jgi:hypothetical protein
MEEKIKILQMRFSSDNIKGSYKTADNIQLKARKFGPNLDYKLPGSG